jgi:hypothetical protein
MFATGSGVTPGKIIPYVFKTAVSLTQSLNNVLATVTSKVAAPLIFNTVGYILDNAPAIASSCVFGKVTWEGLKMFSEPYSSKDSWITFGDRFKRKPELKVKPINLSELVNKDAVTAIADLSVEKAKEIEGNRKNDYTAAKEKADGAWKAVKDSKGDPTVLDALIESAKTMESQADAAKKASESISSQIEKIKKIATPKPKESPKEGDFLGNIKNRFQSVRDSYQAGNLSELAWNSVKMPVDGVQDLMDGISYLAADRKEKAAPENLGMNFSVEMTEKKNFEFPIPFSEEAFILNTENMKKVFTRSAAGAALASIGGLGLVDTWGLTDYVFNWELAYPAKAIGGTVHFASSILGDIAGWIRQEDHWGLGKLIGSGLIFYLGCYRPYQNTNLVWFHFKKNGKDVFDSKTMVKDLTKLAVAAISLTASLYTFNDFVQGN